jgi:hypothetical protein
VATNRAQFYLDVVTGPFLPGVLRVLFQRVQISALAAETLVGVPVAGTAGPLPKVGQLGCPCLSRSEDFGGRV